MVTYAFQHQNNKLLNSLNILPYPSSVDSTTVLFSKSDDDFEVCLGKLHSVFTIKTGMAQGQIIGGEAQSTC